MSKLNLAKKPTWISIGENCFVQGLLKRTNKNTFITPFSWGRSNIDYVISCEKLKFINLLSKKNLYYGEAYGTKVVRSNMITECADIYDESVSSDLEFTHHDPISSDADKQSLERKIERFTVMPSDQPVIIIYHHRLNKKSNIKLLHKKLAIFKDLMEIRSVSCFIIIFHQRIVDSDEKRTVLEQKISHNIYEYTIFSKAMWGGTDDSIFWGLIDDDLLYKMLNLIELRASTYFTPSVLYWFKTLISKVCSSIYKLR